MLGEADVFRRLFFPMPVLLSTLASRRFPKVRLGQLLRITWFCGSRISCRPFLLSGEEYPFFMAHPRIIQGGMGIAVSNWLLARTVSQTGQLGVVSGTALENTLVRRLQLGDLDGKLRMALSQFPLPGTAERILKQYFVPGGKKPEVAFKVPPMPSATPSKEQSELTVAANFAEVFLAKAGHAGEVGINLLEKIQCNTLPALFGSMLAGVDYVLMGAGIPRTIPGTLDDFSAGRPSELKIDVADSKDGAGFIQRFDPSSFFEGIMPTLKRPCFLAIVASATLALTLARKSTGQVDGFIIESESAGGHNAPPRGPMQLSATGEPIYGPRDLPDLEKFRALGLPFWLAGSYGTQGKLEDATKLGAVGIQVGTPFAFCRESGVDPVLKQAVIDRSRQLRAQVFTDPKASPTGFPFKVASVDGSLSEEDIYQARPRKCDMGYLRHPYQKADGSLGYRCPAEPVADYQRKGGSEADTVGRKCLCNGLMSTVGLGQRLSDGSTEPPIVTTGKGLEYIARFIPEGQNSYGAVDVIQALLAPNGEIPSASKA